MMLYSRIKMKDAYFYFAGRTIGKQEVKDDSDLDFITETLIREGFKCGLDLKQQRKRSKRLLMNACDDWHPHQKLTEFQKKLLIGCVLILVKLNEIDNNNDDGYIVLKKRTR